MLPYCLKCKKNAESKNPKAVRINGRRLMLLPKCAVCNNKRSKFIKGQEASGLLSRLGIKAPLKPKKTWVDKVSEFYNRSMKSLLEKMI